MNPFVGTKNSTSLIEMEKLAEQGVLPVEIVDRLANHTLKIVDASFYATRKVSAGTTELMQASDNKVEGVTNLNNRKMEAAQYFLLKGIRVLSATVSGDSAADLAGASFGVASDVIKNAELDITVAGGTAFPRNSCQLFNTTDSNRSIGYYELDCPRLITPQSEIVPTLRINSGATVTNTAVRIELIGSLIIS